MDLKDFVAETLKQIVEGVEEAQTFAKKHGACSNPTNFGVVEPKAIMCKDNGEITAIQRVDFSLLLTTAIEANGKVGIEIFDFVKAGGLYNKICTNSVNFSVLVTLPTDSH